MINPAFLNYIQDTRKRIEVRRLDLTPENRQLIIDANSPREFLGENPTTGVLFIHGMLDSPAIWQDLFEHYAAKNFLCRSILLQGYGTRPEDLLDIKLEDWILNVKKAIDSFSGVVQKLFIFGFSTGAALALYEALENEPIDGLILFAPAIQIKSRWAFTSEYWAEWQDYFKWHVKVHETDYAKYQSIPYNAVYQVYRLTQMIHEKGYYPQKVPMMMILTDDDETISSNTAKKYFMTVANDQSRLLRYRTKPYKSRDSREEIRNSYLPEKSILNFSHICLPISPYDAHYGQHGDYQDYLHERTTYLGKLLRYVNHRADFKGALSIKALLKYRLQRLTYNPDYAYMIQRIDQFIADAIQSAA